MCFLLFNLTYCTIHPDLKRQHGDFSQHFKNDTFYLKALYQVKNINTTNDSYNLKWYTRAAKQGYVSAQNNLGWLYSKTTTQFHNETKAYMWWLITAQNGSHKVLENMVRMETRLAPDNISKAQNIAENVSKATIRLVIDLTGHLLRSKPLHFATTKKNMR